MQDYYTAHSIVHVDYRDTDILGKFIDPHGRLQNSRRTGLTAKHQRQVVQAIKRARFMGLMAYIQA
jgi:small subunit ribosomal protein S18